MAKYIFDLDGTLADTDELNSEAYNHALRALGKEEIYGVKRITRGVVFSRMPLDDSEKEKLLGLKREYFRRHLEKVRLNEKIVHLLSDFDPQDCILWTRAERERVEDILRYFGLEKRFAYVFYSPKRDIPGDIEVLCRLAECTRAQLIFFENDEAIREEIERITSL